MIMLDLVLLALPLHTKTLWRAFSDFKERCSTQKMFQTQATSADGVQTYQRQTNDQSDVYHACPGRKWAQWILLLSANGNISLSAQISPFARAKSQLQVRAKKKTANRAADSIDEK